MAFDNVKLPDDIEKGAQGGPRFRTTIIELSSGFEQRNSQWSQTRGEWDVGYGLQEKEQFEDIIEFFYARQGRARAFRFKDWTDFELARQAIGLTDTTNDTFQIFKRYASGATLFDRILRKIVQDTEAVWVNNVAIAKGLGSGEYQIDYETGIITIGSTLAGQDGTNVEVQCEFDVPVRFNTDALDLVAETSYSAAVPQIPIVEVRI